MLAIIRVLETYAMIMQQIFTPVPGLRHQAQPVGVTLRQRQVLIHQNRGTHTGEGLPVPPTGKSMESTCVLVRQFEDGRLRHVSKVWNDHDARCGTTTPCRGR